MSTDKKLSELTLVTRNDLAGLDLFMILDASETVLSEKNKTVQLEELYQYVAGRINSGGDTLYLYRGPNSTQDGYFNGLFTNTLGGNTVDSGNLITIADGVVLLTSSAIQGPKFLDNINAATGIDLTTENTVIFVSNGIEKARIDGSGLLSLSGDLDTGLRLSGTNQLSLRTGNSDTVTIDTTSLSVNGLIKLTQGGGSVLTIGRETLTDNRTITFPNVSGIVITTGDTGTVTSAMIANGAIVNEDINDAASIADTKIATISTADKVSISAINIDGGMDIGADLADADLIIVDDGAAGSNRKSAVTRIPTYVFGKVSGDITIAGNGTASISSGVIVDADIANNAEIAVSKLADGNARQLLQTSSDGNSVEWASDIDIPGNLDVTGSVTLDNILTVAGQVTLGSSLVFEGATANNFETTLSVVDPTADNVITLPNLSGTVITSGDTGTVTSAMIANDSIVNADIKSDAAIAGTKISPDFGAQTVTTTGVFSLADGTESAPSLTNTGNTNTGLLFPSADTVAITTAGAQKFAIGSFDGNPLIASDYPTYHPSLDLNFAQTQRLDSRITFSRSSSATYFDANGVLQTAATNVARFDHSPSTRESLGLLVEEARTNSFTYSQDFNKAPWVATSALVLPNAITAPDNTQTAAKLVATASTTRGRITYSDSYSSAKTVSAYVKAGEWSYVGVGFTNGSGVWSIAVFNIATGVYSNTTNYSTPVISAYSIQAIENGWYRISATITGSASLVAIMPAQASGDIVNPAWTGDGTSGIYIWGAQLETGSFPTSYIPTPATFTSRASSATYYDASGVIQTAGIDVARSAAYFPDSNGVMRPAGLLLEAAGTNLLLRSEEFDNAAWAQGGALAMTVTANAAVAPDGTTTADKFIRNAGATSGTRQQLITAPNVEGVFSVFAKAGEVSTFNLQPSSSSGFQVTFNVSTGTASSPGGSVTGYGIEKHQNGWYRCWVRAVLDSAYIAIETVAPATGDGTSGIYIWGAQLETGSVPTSYIPTTTATVTRSADVSSSSTVTRSADVAQITGTSFSNWWNASTGTFQASFRSTLSGTRPLLSVDDNTANNRIELYTSSSSQKFTVTTGGAAQADITAGTASSTAINRQSAAYGTNDFSTSLTGATAVTDTSGTVPVVTQLRIGADQAGNTRTSPIARLTYWPVRLSDSTLAAITR